MATADVPGMPGNESGLLNFTDIAKRVIMRFCEAVVCLEIQIAVPAITAIKPANAQGSTR